MIYGYIIDFFECCYIVYCVSNLCFFILLPTLPRGLGIFISINISEANLMVQVMREYFIDQEKYSYLILLHLDAAMCIGAITVTASGTIIAGCLKHICGIFRIAR